jgi:cytoskeletal protein CcmA (bactofilin family)
MRATAMRAFRNCDELPSDDNVLMRHSRTAKVSLFFLRLAVTTVCAADRQLEQVLGGDRYISGGNVIVDQPTIGDLLAAGGDLVLSAAVAGDAAVAGGNLRLRESIGQDAYVAGGHVSLESSIGRNARIAGGTIELARQAHIAANATIAGGYVRVLGNVGGVLTIGGGRVYLDGSVAGDVEASGGQIELGPHARISGKLRYQSREALKQDPAATIVGGVEQGALPHLWWRGDHLRAAENAGFWLWRIGLIALALALVSALPAACARVARSAREKFALCVFVGLIAVAIAPFAIVLLAITLIGLPLALLALLAYCALLIIGYIACGIALGEAALARIKPAQRAALSWRLGFVALAVLTISLLGAAPGIGGLVSLLALFVGSGAIVQAARE